MRKFKVGDIFVAEFEHYGECVFVIGQVRKCGELIRYDTLYESEESRAYRTVKYLDKKFHRNSVFAENCKPLNLQSHKIARFYV